MYDVVLNGTVMMTVSDLAMAKWLAESAKIANHVDHAEVRRHRCDFVIYTA